MHMYNSQFELGHVALNVRDLELQSLFYQQVLGLQVLSQNSKQIDLGAGKTTLVRLIQTEQKARSATATDSTTWPLSYQAVKTWAPFSATLSTIRFLQGASDHGYSEAIYLADTEGNGIEIYRDLPQDTWDVRPDGHRRHY